LIFSSHAAIPALLAANAGKEFDVDGVLGALFIGEAANVKRRDGVVIEQSCEEVNERISSEGKGAEQK
jgi:hypothetical protein